MPSVCACLLAYFHTRCLEALVSTRFLSVAQQTTPLSFCAFLFALFGGWPNWIVLWDTVVALSKSIWGRRFAKFLYGKKKRGSGYPRQLAGLWRYFLISIGSLSHNHFVQTAEPSRVAVGQPSLQRTSLAGISKYTQTALIPPLHSLSGQFALFVLFCFFLFCFFCKQLALKERACKTYAISISMHFHSAYFQYAAM